MALQTFTPSGIVKLGNVPWDDTYRDVRLYGSLSEQSTDISSLMSFSTDNYVYVAPERRLKLSYRADEIYGVNYCMYRNESLAGRWVYCFVSNISYVNDNTCEVDLEVDIFQTFLYGYDWTLKPCMVERETPAIDGDMTQLIAPEPDMQVLQKVDGQADLYFETAGFGVTTSEYPEIDVLIANVLNPEGWKGTPLGFNVLGGVPMGANVLYFPVGTTSGGSEYLELFLKEMNSAGAIDAIVSIFTVPSFGADRFDTAGESFAGGYPLKNSKADSVSTYDAFITAPARGDAVDGYTPKNKKLLYYPYTYCRITDFNGSSSDLKYELMDNLVIAVKYAPFPTCSAYVYPSSYMGTVGLDYGITTSCGTQGSWCNDQFANWLAQNSGSFAASVVNTVVGIAGSAAVSTAAGLLKDAGTLARNGYPRMAGVAAGDAAENVGREVVANSSSLVSWAGSAVDASKMPVVMRGTATPDMTSITGIQGVHAQRVCPTYESARVLDDFFSMFGYATNVVKDVLIDTRASWNYVKTVGSVVSSYRSAPSDVPYQRRGTPSEAVSAIASRFDAGVTFWHTTSGFGDYTQGNDPIGG